MHRFARLLLATLLCAPALGAHAGVGYTTLPGVQGDHPVTVFYPTAAPERPTQVGILTLQLAPDAAPVRGNGRLVVVSHGSGGMPTSHADLARALVDAGFVVALPRHRGDNAIDPSEPGPESWKKRPGEASRAIDAVAQHAALAPLLSFDRVGLFGMSAGGHTALSFAGGRWSPSAFARHCEQRIADDFPFCVGLITRLKGDMLDGVKKTLAVFAIRQLFDGQPWFTHEDRRVQAVVAAVPAAADFDLASLAVPRVPLGLVTTGRDRWLHPRFHARPLLAACAPRCRVVAHMAGGDHGSILSPQPPFERLSPLAAELLSDPPGFDRRELHQVHARIAAFFRHHLLP